MASQLQVLYDVEEALKKTALEAMHAMVMSWISWIYTYNMNEKLFQILYLF